MSMDNSKDTLIAGNLSIDRCARAGAIVALVLFLICWVLAVLDIGGHNMLALLTSAPARSAMALVTGTICAALFGGLTGALIAGAYNFAGPRQSGRRNAD